MEQLTIQVKGSTPDPYETTFIKDGDSLTALCTCPAGSFSNVCKHRVAVLDDDKGKVPQVVEWLAGTDVEAALLGLRELEADKEADKDALVAAKRKLARAMNS